MQTWIGFAYLATVAGSAAMFGIFYVSGLVWLLILAVIIIGPATIGKKLIIDVFSGKGSDKSLMAFGFVHILAAILLHPAVSLQDSMIHAQIDQFEILGFMQSAGADWHAKLRAGLDLARAIQYDALFSMKIASPALYWLYPPSMVFAAWGIIMLIAGRRTKD